MTAFERLLQPRTPQTLSDQTAARLYWHFTGFTIRGAEATIQSAPFHRIDGLYYYAKKLGAGDAVFTSDGEIEFVCIPDGLLFDCDVKTK